MIRYALTRLALLLLGLFVASALIFMTLRVLPGDVAQLIAGVNSTPDQVAAIRDRLGLDDPLPVQYAAWIGGVLQGDLGSSLLTGSSVADELVQKGQVTIPLGLMAMTIAMLVALPFGVISAMRRGHADGTALNVTAQTLAAVPVVWAGMMLVVVFAVWLGWLPAQGFPRSGWSDPGLAFRSLLLPAITIGVIEGAMLMRFVRSATLQATGQDFVRTAAAKGLTRNQALVRHGLPTVGLSIITVLGLQVAGIIVGSVVIEQLFSLPGIGRMLVADVGNRDLPKVQGELLVLTGFVLVVGFVVDLVHRVIDPRQREAE
ncbi:MULTISPECIES: ABC transporter permease [Microbacterium]|uniref:Peptide/nickel transport system permease protein n=1 Tax=Microbacterium lacticum TaxID=33885 RepID=A0A4Y3URQ1_9MICO|nr:MULTISPECIES: ABC transporter permease [Microbacterium]MBG0717802.1 ABC transporter permease [Microbacterium paulum]MCC9053699.1 ABC transporter permease [Microbacterium sp. F2E]TQM95066.1 peptide/nickel transport system permease protein [Microbacterium lacticum]GEB96050.1 ABC transporter permease [Microbacterium lacticum]GGI67654.1 ABC transporter permease [Microbacterium lacticum]